MAPKVDRKEFYRFWKNNQELSNAELAKRFGICYNQVNVIIGKMIAEDIANQRRIKHNGKT